MKYFLLIATIALSFIEGYSILSDGNSEKIIKIFKWKNRLKRGVKPQDVISHIEAKDIEKGPFENKYVLPYQIPKDKLCNEDLAIPSYAKVTCTSFPGRVVCQLGRYTFVINNGDHKMEPEVIERFAAMVYHRTQEGDSKFDVAVDTPTKDECFCPEAPAETTATAVKEEPKAPIFIECSPVKEERKLCNPSFAPSEVIYTCKKKHTGIGKRMVISVGRDGTVSDGELTLPYSAHLEERFKRGSGPPPDVRQFTDICNEGERGKWCPNMQQTQRCATSDCMTTDPCKVPPRSNLINREMDLKYDKAHFYSGIDNDPFQQEINVEARGSLVKNIVHEKGSHLGIHDINNAALVNFNVRNFTDECVSGANCSWCPPTKQINDPTQGCITRPTCKLAESDDTLMDREKRQESLKEKEVLKPFRNLPGIQRVRNLKHRKELFKQRRQAVGLCASTEPVTCQTTTTCPPSTTTCPTPATACGPVPDPPADVPQCVTANQCPPKTCQTTPNQRCRKAIVPRIFTSDKGIYRNNK